MGDKFVALDIGSSSLRGVEAVYTSRSATPQITKIGEIALDTHIISDGKIESPESLTTAIGRLWREAKFDATKVFTVASGAVIMTAEVDRIPWAEPAHFKNLLEYSRPVEDALQLEERSDYYYDAHVLDTYVDRNERFNRALVTAVSKDYVDTLIRCLQANRLKPFGIDVSPFALIRAQQFHEPELETQQETDGEGSYIQELGLYNPNVTREREVVANIEIGASTIINVLHEKGQPVYIYTTPSVGGDSTTQRISSSLHVTTAEAEMLKVGMSYPEEVRSQFSQTVVREDGVGEVIRWADFSEDDLAFVNEIISQDVSNFINEIRGVIDDATMSDDIRVTKIVLSGGGAKLNTFVGRLSSELNINVELAQPFGEEQSKRINEGVFDEQYRYMTAFGLLLGQDYHG